MYDNQFQPVAYKNQSGSLNIKSVKEFASLNSRFDISLREGTKSSGSRSDIVMLDDIA